MDAQQSDYEAISPHDQGGAGPGTYDTRTTRQELQHPAARVPGLKTTFQFPNTPSDSNSDGEYGGEEVSPAAAVAVLRRRPKPSTYDSSAIATPDIVPLDPTSMTPNSSSEKLEIPTAGETKGSSKKAYVLASDDEEVKEILRKGLEMVKEKKEPRHKRKHFRDLVFTKQFSAFDRHNQAAINSPFHGFYVLFWIAVAFLIIKMATDNWRKTGSVLGTNDILKYMFRREVVTMLVSDGIMCGITGLSWMLQRQVLSGRVAWERTGWIMQSVWELGFLVGFVGLTFIRDWPWTHTVFFVLHGIVMLMKQHSYAFYNGYLSTVYHSRQNLLHKLSQLESMSPATSPSATNPPVSALSTSHLSHRPSASEYQTRRMSLSPAKSGDPSDIEAISRAIESGEPLASDQLEVFEKLIKWEIEALSDELNGQASDPSHSYPNNLTFSNHYEYIVLPTVVYELEYPRSDNIDWLYVAEKFAAFIGVMLVMIMVSQTFIYPVVIHTVMMKELGLTAAQRLHEFPWVLSDLVFPFMMEYLMAWYLIWETTLNILAELTYFADRSFYDTWWNSVSWDQFARDWNRPVHNFLLRHVYHSSISSMRVNKHTATLITFFLSAVVHELVMWCIFKKLRGYLLVLQMCQLPLVRLSRTRWLRNQKTIGNIMFWVGIFTGPSLLCSLYLVL
ncbi:MBOAT family protein [Xylariomycetidae sp. FL0641]|nr:MBOAT family protein [Xylariomycetidae sp. FL0641]